jgi:hypothetical protein
VRDRLFRGSTLSEEKPVRAIVADLFQHLQIVEQLVAEERSNVPLRRASFLWISSSAGIASCILLELLAK